MDFLVDDSFFNTELLDAATLAAITECAEPNRKKRPASEQKVKVGSEDENSSDERDGDGPSSKKSCSQSAKASREKARREKLNERFLELARLLDPGKEPKTDKLSVLADAIKFVRQITVENNQLRQLNKFLEERVSHFETERGQALLRQRAMFPGHMPMMAPMAMAAPAPQPGQQSMVAQHMAQPAPHPMMMAAPMATMQADHMACVTGVPCAGQYYSAPAFPSAPSASLPSGHPVAPLTSGPCPSPVFSMDPAMMGGWQPMAPQQQPAMQPTSSSMPLMGSQSGDAYVNAA